jgi:hypothetical protein
VFAYLVVVSWCVEKLGMWLSRKICFSMGLAETYLQLFVSNVLSGEFHLVSGVLLVLIISDCSPVYVIIWSI